MSLEPADSNDYFYNSADGLRLYCGIYAARQAGGLPVLCLPGLTRNSRDFATLAQRLCAQHEVLTPDLRGRGRSAWDTDPDALSAAVLCAGRHGRCSMRAA